jgi:RHS repeat-associated protein
LTNRSGSSGGPMMFAGSLSKPGTVTVDGNPSTVNPYTTNFVGYAAVTNGTKVVPIIANDYNGHSQTNNYQVVVTNNGVSETITYDLNGNETSVITATSTNTYQWDAANRLVSITGPTNQSVFAYDGLGRWVQDIEWQSGVPVSTNKFLWCGTELCEERDYTGTNVIKRFFGEGEQMSGTNYFFTRDHLGSIREMVDGGGTIQARYDYDPYGQRTQISGSLDADFAYAGYYYHSVSGLYLTLYRGYDSGLGRWLNRDPIGEAGGLNLYGFVGNNPINRIDPNGLWGIAFGNNSGSSYFNLGWGNPSLYFSPSSGNDALQGAEAFADGANPFGNPFANNGFYDPCDKSLQGSRHIGTATAITEGALGLGAAAFWAPGTSIFWSGAGAGETAAALAEAGEGSTIGNTLGGWALNSLGVENETVWNTASWFYANTTGSEAIVVLGEGGGVAGTTLGDVEAPVLAARGIQVLTW